MEKSIRPGKESIFDKRIQIIRNKETIGNYCFYIAMLLLSIVMIVGHSVWEVPYRGRVLQLAFVLCCIKIIVTEYSVKEWLTMLLFGVLGAVSYLAISEEYVISIVVMIFAAKSVEMRPIIKWLFYGVLVGTICIAVLSLLQVGGMVVDIRDYGRGGMESRWCLGFSHANGLHGTLWYLSALFIYLYFKKLKWSHYLVLTALNIGLYMLTLSRAGLLAVQILIIAAWLLCYYPKIGRNVWIFLLGEFCIVAAMVLSLVSVSIPKENSPLLQALDRFLTGRITLAYAGANIVNWRLLSHAGELWEVDNGWVTTFFNYGYLVGIVFVAVQIYLIYVACKRQNGIYLAILVTNAFYTLMEASYTMNSAYYLCNLSYVVAMLMMGEKNESAGFESEDKGNIFGSVN